MKIVIIGAGPAGYVAALRAAQLGSEVMLVEKEKVGGTCLNVGCIPTKSMIEHAEMWYKFCKHNLFSHIEKNSVIPPWEVIYSQKNAVVKQLRAGVEHLLKKKGVKMFYGSASISDRNTVAVSSEEGLTEIKSDAILIATGSTPSIPPIPGVKDENGDLYPGVMTSNELIRLEEPIDSLCVIGGGAIGLEFASIYSAMGTRVVVVEAEQEIAPAMDPDIRKVLRASLEERGIRFYTKKAVAEVNVQTDGMISVRLLQGEGESIQVSRVLLATGRRPNTGGLGLDQAGIVHERGRIKVNANYQTSLSNIYAVGDCSSSMMLAHVASKEAILAVEHMHAGTSRPLNYDRVPQVIYTHPEAAGVGLTFYQAEERGYQVREDVFPLSGNGRALTSGETGFMKIVSEKKWGQVLGVHMVGPHISEIVNQASLALHLECTVDELAEMIHAHPTVAEGLGEAAMIAKGQGIHL